MKWAIFLFLLMLLLPLGAQLRTRYVRVPTMERVWRKAWVLGHRRWFLRFEFVRVVA
jgi:hypothetical protein